MQIRHSWRQRALPAAAVVCALALCGCTRKESDTTSIGTFRMGERVQVGPVVYSVLEAEWKPALTEGGRAPKDRFLLLKVSMTNSGASAVSVPAFELHKPDGGRYEEVTHNVEGVQQWLGLLRNLPPSETQEGYVIFDAPIGAYKLQLRDTDLTSETHAMIDIPVHLE